jgi:two-component system NarL family sensor kinase
MYLAETRARTAEKDKKIAEDQRLIQAQQFEVRQKNMWIGLISGGALLLIGILGSLYSVNRHKQQLQAKKIQIMQQEQEILQLMALMKGEEQERTRLARELHDGIGGMLAAIKMNFSTLRNQCEPLLREYNAPLRPGSFQNIMDLISEASVEVRETAHNLAPNSLIQYGLVEALKLYVEKINNSDQLFIKLEAEQDIKGLDESVQLNLYRIIQELVQNIIKHSGASNALIQLVRSGDMLYISVRDNGKGLSSTDQPGAGLHNARLRVKALHGEIDIESTKGHGLFVRMSFNLEHLTNPSYEHPGSHSG